MTSQEVPHAGQGSSQSQEQAYLSHSLTPSYTTHITDQPRTRTARDLKEVNRAILSVSLGEGEINKEEGRNYGGVNRKGR